MRSGRPTFVPILILETIISLLFQPKVPPPPQKPLGVIAIAESREEYPPRQEPTLKDAVFALADEYGVPRETVDNLITCESNWNPDAVGFTGDVGLWQISPYYWPEVDAKNPLEATKWALQRIKDGYIHEWTCANCYSYMKWYFDDLPRMAEIVPNSYAFEGAIAIFNYKGVKHLAYIKKFNKDTFTVTEANYTPGKIADREVKYNDPALIGFFDPSL